MANQRSVEAAVLKRAAGALLGAAVGDALGGGSGSGPWVDVTAAALSSLGDPWGLRDALGDPSEVGAGLLWALAIRHTVLTGELDARVGLTSLPADVQKLWSRRLAAAEQPSSSFPNATDDVVEAVQAAWSTIFHTEVLPYDMERHFTDALQNALAAGPVVAAIAGGLLGACHGDDSVPAEWASELADPDAVERRGRALASASWAEDPDAELFDLPGGE